MMPITRLGYASTRATIGQKLRLFAKPLVLISMYAIAAARGSWWWLGALFLIPFIAANLSIVMHDVGHGLVGGRARHWLLFIVGVASMLSGHAFWATHSQHHRRFPSSDKADPEGAPAKQSFCSMITRSILFVPQLWLWARQNKPGTRCWLWAELFGATGLLLSGAILWWWHSSAILLVYSASALGTSWVGYALVAWLSHQSDILSWPRKQALAATALGSVLVFFFGVILFHEEHHAQEKVPSCNLTRFARQSSAV